MNSALSSGIRISAVFPALNEAESVGPLIRQVSAGLAACCSDWEVILVDDGSTDGTAEAARRAGAEIDGECRVIEHGVNRGYSAALRSGLEVARHPYVFYSDADCQYDFTEIGRLAALADRYDIVAGSRVRRSDVWTRRVASRVFNCLANALFCIRFRDIDCAFKLFRRSVFDVIEVETDHFLFDTEVLFRARLLGLKLIEIPVTHLPRAAGASTVKVTDVFDTLRGFAWLLGNRGRWNGVP